MWCSEECLVSFVNMTICPKLPKHPRLPKREINTIDKYTMNKLLTFLLAAMAFVACTQNEVEELTANRADVPETLTVGFEGGDTRVELNDALKTVWTEGDEVSVFYQSYDNMRWAFQGTTGDRSGELKLVSGEITEQTMDNIIVAYPYDANYRIDIEDKALHASLPAVQSYKEGSYGAEGNIMVAAGDYRQFILKSVVGWLRVELTGEGESVKSITLCGNAGEQVAGLVYINAADASIALAGSEVEESLVATEVVLNCGDGVELGAEATEFYVALLPQTFEKGMTVEVDYSNGNSQTLVCENNVTIRRNHISPINIEASEEEDVVNSQIFYTATALVEPNNTSAFNVAIVSNEWNEATGEGVITFDGELTTIGDSAFENCDSLTSVTIPDSVTTIGWYAFSHCFSLTSVTIGNSVTMIGVQVFYECTSLTSVTIPNSVTTIGIRAFYYCSSLTSVTIGDNVTTIGDLAFSNCSSLTSVTIPDSVTTIGYEAFYECSSLTSVTIGDRVTAIGNYAFYDCTRLTSVYCKATTPPTLGGSYVFAYNKPACKIYVPAESVGAYKAAENWSEYASYIVGYNFETGEEEEIPTNQLWYTATALVKPYKSSAFNVAIVSNEWNEATGEYVITFDGELTTIGYQAFRECNSLISVTIPDSVTTIGYGAFSNCANLTSVTIPDSVTTIEKEAFAGCSRLTSVTIGNSVTTIGNNAFEWCDSLTSVTIPDSVTTIGYRVFYYCRGLRSVTIPDSVTTIGVGAFYSCGSLTSVTIPDSVTTIGYEAFYECSSLTSVTIGDRVTAIGNYAFYDCTRLTSVYCKATTPPTLGGSYVFEYNEYGRKIYVPAESVEAYKAAAGWSEYAYYIVGYNFETGEEEEIPTNQLWYTATALVKPYKSSAFNAAIFSNEWDKATGEGIITFDGELTSIGDAAFYLCSSLTSVTIPDSVTTIGDETFRNCDSLTSVYCEAITPPNLGDYVFDGNASGRTIYIPAESVWAYKAAENWSEYVANIVGYDFETGAVVE